MKKQVGFAPYLLKGDSMKHTVICKEIIKHALLMQFLHKQLVQLFGFDLVERTAVCKMRGLGFLPITEYVF